MYTEENEFDYNEYLSENENGNNKSNLGKTTIIKIILILICLLIIIFLVFKIKNGFTKKETNNNTPQEVIVDKQTTFNNNLRILKVIGEKYFFEQGNYPKEKGQTESISVKGLIDKNIIKELVIKENTACAYDISNINVTKNSKDYLMEINLTCSDLSDKVSYYYDLDFKCLTCNGEIYVSPSDDENNNDLENNDDNNNSTLVCKDYSEWTEEYKEDSDLEYETRVVVSAYKDLVTYGEWSSYTTTPIFENENLEVEAKPIVSYNSNYTAWSALSTKKPENKEGREIQSEVKSVKTTNCQTGTYTKTRTTWDSNALKCEYKGYANIVCTYKKACTSSTTSKTYYKYRDLVLETKENIYYRSRTINKTTNYINFIPENEIPDGYLKLDGSEVVQYRYREKCIVK